MIEQIDGILHQLQSCGDNKKSNMTGQDLYQVEKMCESLISRRVFFSLFLLKRRKQVYS